MKKISRKKRLAAVALAALMTMICAGTGCGIKTVAGPDLEEPVVIEELCWFSADYFSFSYIRDFTTDTWKEVKELRIPALGNAAFTVETEEESSGSKYDLYQVNVYLDRPVKKDTVIDEVTIVWEDDTETEAEIGQAVLLAGVTSEDLDCEREDYDVWEESGGMLDADDNSGEGVFYVNYSTVSDRWLTGAQLPSKETRKLVEFIQLDGSDVEDDIFPVYIEDGEWYQIAWAFSEEADQYGIIQIPAFVMTKDSKEGKEEKPAAFFYISKTIDSEAELIDALKQAI